MNQLHNTCILPFYSLEDTYLFFRIHEDKMLVSITYAVFLVSWSFEVLSKILSALPTSNPSRLWNSLICTDKDGKRAAMLIASFKTSLELKNIARIIKFNEPTTMHVGEKEIQKRTHLQVAVISIKKNIWKISH